MGATFTLILALTVPINLILNFLTIPLSKSELAVNYWLKVWTRTILIISYNLKRFYFYHTKINVPLSQKHPIISQQIKNTMVCCAPSKLKTVNYPPTPHLLCSSVKIGWSTGSASFNTKFTKFTKSNRLGCWLCINGDFQNVDKPTNFMLLW